GARTGNHEMVDSPAWTPSPNTGKMRFPRRMADVPFTQNPLRLKSNSVNVDSRYRSYPMRRSCSPNRGVARRYDALISHESLSKWLTGSPLMAGAPNPAPRSFA